MIQKILIAFFLVGFMLSCSATSPRQPAILTKKDLNAGCDNPYVVLPGNYIIDLAAGSEVFLNPDIQNFALFCDSDEARLTLERDMSAGRIRKENDWRVYRIEGNSGEIGRECGAGQICLDQQAKILEWVEK